MNKLKQQYYIYQEILKKNPQPFQLWLNTEFWIYWFQNDINERPNIMLNKEDFYFSLLSEMATMMNNLNFELQIILEIIINNIACKYITCDLNLIKDLEKTIIKQHNYLAKIKDF